MRHQKKQAKIGRPRDARRLLIGNLLTSLIIHEKIQTTEAKAKALQPFVDKLISTTKKSKEKRTAIRNLQAVLQNEMSCRKVLEELITRYADRNSGFTRITPIKFRAGDNAPLVQIELI